jgi:hypothetical protein
MKPGEFRFLNETEVKRFFRYGNKTNAPEKPVNKRSATRGRA